MLEISELVEHGPSAPKGVKIKHLPDKGMLEVRLARVTHLTAFLTMISYFTICLVLLIVGESKDRLHGWLLFCFISLEPETIDRLCLSLYSLFILLLSIPTITVLLLRRVTIWISPSAVILRGFKTRRFDIAGAKSISVTSKVRPSACSARREGTSENPEERNHLEIYISNARKKECKWLNEVFRILLRERTSA